MRIVDRVDALDLGYMKKLVASSHAFMYICAVILFTMLISSVFEGDEWLEQLAFSVVLCALSIPMFALIWWPFRHVSADYKAGQKAVEKTTIERLQKIGFFEMQADSALGIMAGAIYYLWIPDETRSPPRRRFRIGLTSYRELMLYGSGSPVEISYLPKSGMILTIDTPTYHYKAWESRFKRPGNQPQP